ncbi:MAG TPA: M50 family metallopeptidase [Candidatus Ozemobacteraceae bacterium]|nr:M50 family metallopeptidase [Candidatus Ozemobacteraceae bacterium]
MNPDERMAAELLNPGKSLAGEDPARRLPLAGMGLPVILFLLSLWQWDSLLVFPFKILTVFFHELSHGLAAVLTGGSIESITLSANEGGVCATRGGSWWLILTAGYLGSLVWGSLLLLTAARTRNDRLLTQVLGAGMLVITVLYVRSLFGFVFCLAFGAALLYAGQRGSELFCDQFLRYMGLTSMYYVLIDIKSDLIDRSIPCSDAYRFAQLVHLPPTLVGLIWLGIALFLTWRTLRATLPATGTGATGGV